MSPLIKALMERDSMTEQEAKEDIKQATKELQELVDKGETPLDFMQERFGLEPDYLFEIMVKI